MLQLFSFHSEFSLYTCFISFYFPFRFQMPEGDFDREENHFVPTAPSAALLPLGRAVFARFLYVNARGPRAYCPASLAISSTASCAASLKSSEQNSLSMPVSRLHAAGGWSAYSMGLYLPAARNSAIIEFFGAPALSYTVANNRIFSSIRRWTLPGINKLRTPK